jgi:hypothetical protein
MTMVALLNITTRGQATSISYGDGSTAAYGYDGNR